VAGTVLTRRPTEADAIFATDPLHPEMELMGQHPVRERYSYVKMGPAAFESVVVPFDEVIQGNLRMQTMQPKIPTESPGRNEDSALASHVKKGRCRLELSGVPLLPDQKECPESIGPLVS
jgi:hypothetical protein